MKIPEIPENEAGRIETLRSLEILDSFPEERFDRITRMAKRVFDVPIALVSLVDVNRQWFKSCQGLDVSETPREVSFCGHAILQSHIFLIPDTLADERFADNPLVTGEPRIRFYAGRPIKASNGHTLGTLCIIDTVPRTLEEVDLKILGDMGEMIEEELAAVEMATQDELTHLANRRGFQISAEQNLQLCSRYNLPMSLVFIDLDQFKEINDTFGHAEGDRALIMFSEHLKKVSRASDVIARFSGDEFIALLINASEEFAEVFVTHLHEVLDKHNQFAQNKYHLKFSHGIVEFNKDQHKSIDNLISEGDSLMYELKKNKQEKLS